MCVLLFNNLVTEREEFDTHTHTRKHGFKFVVVVAVLACFSSSQASVLFLWHLVNAATCWCFWSHPSKPKQENPRLPFEESNKTHRKMSQQACDLAETLAASIKIELLACCHCVCVGRLMLIRINLPLLYSALASDKVFASLQLYFMNDPSYFGV